MVTMYHRFRIRRLCLRQEHRVTILTTQMQYAVVVAVVSAIGYVIAGFVHIWWLVLGISAVLLLVVLFVIKAVTSDEKDGVKKRA